jgi:hypothetical protein
VPGMGANSDGERSVSDMTVGTVAKSNGAPRQGESEESLRPVFGPTNSKHAGCSKVAPGRHFGVDESAKQDEVQYCPSSGM